MKRRTMKLLWTNLVLVCMLLVSLSVSAGAAVIDSPEISPQYTGVARIKATLEVSDTGYATCYGTVTPNDGYSVDFTLQLKRDGVAIKTWNNSGTSTLSIDKGYYLTPGYDYQVVATAKVKNSSGTIVETATAKSVVVPYKN